MADSDDDLDDSIQYNCALPATWSALDAPPDEFEQAGYDKANLVLLDGIAMLEEHTKLDEASPMYADIARLDAKLDLMMAMLTRLLANFHESPQQQSLALTSRHVAWREPSEVPAGEFGLLELYVHPTIATPLMLPLKLVGGGRGEIVNMGSRAQNSWEKYIFRQHRREIALSKGVSP